MKDLKLLEIKGLLPAPYIKTGRILVFSKREGPKRGPKDKRPRGGKNGRTLERLFLHRLTCLKIKNFEEREKAFDHDAPMNLPFLMHFGLQNKILSFSKELNFEPRRILCKNLFLNTLV